MKSSPIIWLLMNQVLFFSCQKGKNINAREASSASASNAGSGDSSVKTSNAFSVPNIGLAPKCDAEHANMLAFAVDERRLYVCDRGQWLAVDLLAKDGDSKLLLQQTSEGSGENCRYGGRKAESGIDRNNDKTLGADEGTSSIFICEPNIDAVARNIFKQFVHSIALVIVEADVPSCTVPDQVTRRPVSAGTGWVVAPDVVVTNYHVADRVAAAPFPCFPLPTFTMTPPSPTPGDSESPPPPEPIGPQPPQGSLSIAVRSRLPELFATDEGTGGPDYLAMTIKVYFPKSSIGVDTLLRQGLPHYAGFVPSPEDFDVVEVIKVDRNPGEVADKTKRMDLALLQIPPTTRAPLIVSGSNPASENAATLRVPDEIFHIGYDLTVGPRLASGKIFQMQSCKGWTRGVSGIGSDDCETEGIAGNENILFSFFGYGDHGGSGSPIFDRFGKVTGILTFGSSASQSTYVVGQSSYDIARWLALPRQWGDL